MSQQDKLKQKEDLWDSLSDFQIVTAAAPRVKLAGQLFNRCKRDSTKFRLNQERRACIGPHGNNLLRKDSKARDYVETTQTLDCCKLCFTLNSSTKSEVFSSPKARCSKDPCCFVKKSIRLSFFTKGKFQFTLSGIILFSVQMFTLRNI